MSLYCWCPHALELRRSTTHEPMREISIETPPGFSQLTKVEQVRYLQALWDEISESSGDIPIPKTHLKLAEARLARYKQDPSSAHPAFEILDRLKEKSRS
jgi:putative addiction module component (TIGR02574 family)